MVNEKIKKQILNEIFKYLSEEKVCVILFGFAALNKDIPHSDIDIGLFSTEKIDDEVFLNLQEDLNYYVDTSRLIDLVDFQRVSLDFLEFALKETVIWHVGKEFLEKFLISKEILDKIKSECKK